MPKGITMRPINVLFAAAATIGFGLAAPAAAAPQMLALVQSHGPVKLTCLGRECFAEFTAFCLQPDRASPVEGTRYRLTGNADVRLVGSTADGRRIVLDPGELELTAQRTHVAVRVAMPHRRLGELDLQKVTVEVGTRVALVPTPVPGDDAPLSESEIAVAAGPLRTLGKQLVDDDDSRMVAARVTSRMINALPARGRESETEREGLAERVLGPGGIDTVPEKARELVGNAYEFCSYVSGMGTANSMRECLSGHHDSFVGQLNNRYWDAVRTGT